jgi:hypothetical protein
MNKQKGFSTVLGLVIALVIVGAGAYIYNEKQTQSILDGSEEIETGIVITSPYGEGDMPTSLPVRVTGYVPDFSGWGVFEGSAGIVELHVMYQGKDKVIASEPLSLSDFSYDSKGPFHFDLTLGDREWVSNIDSEDARLVFKEAGAKDGDGIDQFEIKIKISKAQPEARITVKSSGIALPIPEGLPKDRVTSHSEVEGTIWLDQGYWESLGYSGKVSNSLSVTKNLNSTDGQLNCDVYDLNTPTATRSKIETVIDDQAFLSQITSYSDELHTGRTEHYIQMINDTQCRTITFILLERNPDTLSEVENPDEVRKNNAVFAPILNRMRDEIFNGIEISEPGY